MKYYFLIVSLFLFVLLSAQSFKSRTLSKIENSPIGYVNVGILNKNIGTTSDAKGSFELFLDSKYNNDSLTFSCIGYEIFNIAVSDFKNLKINNIFLSERTYKLAETIVLPKKLKKKTLGVTTKSKSIASGFSDNILGYEMGIMMPVKKSAKINSVNLNISYCKYDTIFYRINVYEVRDRRRKIYENVLLSPVYLTIPKDKIKGTLSLDLSNKDIWVNGDCLVTIECVKNLGKGNLYFCSGIGHSTYFRKTSQGEWKSVPIGISLSVNVDLEY